MCSKYSSLYSWIKISQADNSNTGRVGGISNKINQLGEQFFIHPLTDMTENIPNLASDDELNQKVPIDRENTLQMVRNDYEEPWKGVLREAIQNAADAWGRNMSAGVLPSDTGLTVDIEIDSQEGVFRYEDTAGGMSKEILEKNLVGIDTPDEEKQEGDSAGSYGRGFHVVASVGMGKAYVETKHRGKHYCVTLDNSGNHSTPVEPEDPQLEQQGTFIQVQDIRTEDLENGLGDWGAVEDVLLENFNFLLLKPDVNISYTLDGDNFEPTPVDLTKYVDDGLIEKEDSLDQFNHSGETYQIEDLVVVAADAVESDPPWEGIAMLKGNEYIEHPFMTVQTYKPHNIRSLNKPAQMFGWCDANDLCPDLEDNAHTNFNSTALGKSGLKEKLRKIHNENFRREQKTEEREELRGDITQHINQLLTSFETFNDYQITGSSVSNSISSGVEKQGESVESGSGSGYTVVCQAGKRDFDIGDDVPLQIAIENSSDSDIKKFEIQDISVTSDVLSEEIQFEDKTIEVEPNETQRLDLKGFNPSKEGEYVFKAKGEPLDEDGNKDYSNVYVRVGDVNPDDDTVEKESEGSEEDAGEDGQSTESSQQSVAIVENSHFSPDPQDEYKASLEKGENGGFEVLINTDRPEWSAAEEIDDDLRRKTIQDRLGTLWGIEQIILQKNVDDAEDIINSDKANDEKFDELMDRLYERDDLLAEIESMVATEHGVGYE